MKVVGIEAVDYVSKKSGERVQGVTLHCLNDENPENSAVVGQTTEKVYVSVKADCFSVLKDIKAGHEIKVFYNKYGAVDDILNVTLKK